MLEFDPVDARQIPGRSRHPQAPVGRSRAWKRSRWSTSARNADILPSKSTPLGACCWILKTRKIATAWPSGAAISSPAFGQSCRSSSPQVAVNKTDESLVVVVGWVERGPMLDRHGGQVCVGGEVSRRGRPTRSGEFASGLGPGRWSLRVAASARAPRMRAHPQAEAGDEDHPDKS
jgi:hypothetical protein